MAGGNLAAGTDGGNEYVAGSGADCNGLYVCTGRPDGAIADLATSSALGYTEDAVTTACCSRDGTFAGVDCAKGTFPVILLKTACLAASSTGFGSVLEWSIVGLTTEAERWFGIEGCLRGLC